MLPLSAYVKSWTQRRNIRLTPTQKCWRANLQTKLRADGVTNFDFVGTKKSSCGGANIDQDHEGHPGSQATDYAAKGNLTVWLNQVDTPDVILMLLGTNDVLLGKKPVGDILKAYDVLIQQMREKNPKIRVLFSNLLPLDPARWPVSGAEGIKQLNNAIKQYVPSKNTRDSPVVFVDNFTGFNAVSDTADGEHPNESGNEKMATQFFGPTKDAIKAVSAAKKTRTRRASDFLSRRLAMLMQ